MTGIAPEAWGSITRPPPRKVAITPADTDLTDVIAALYVGVGGTIVATCPATSNVLTYQNVSSGSYLLGPFSRVASTTTASGLIGYW